MYRETKSSGTIYCMELMVFDRIKTESYMTPQEIQNCG